MKTYEAWILDVIRLIRENKTIDQDEQNLCRAMHAQGYDPATAVCVLQDLRDGGDGVDDGGELVDG